MPCSPQPEIRPQIQRHRSPCHALRRLGDVCSGAVPAFMTSTRCPVNTGTAMIPRDATDPAITYGRVGKRMLDVAGAVALLVVLAPLIGVTSLAVWICSGRPILFRDRRSGLDGQPFTLLKFRSMREGRAADDTPLADAARLTGFGRFLRQTSLDELPQLFCVLTGSMSLVGPRPLPERYLARYSARQTQRLRVRPGLTGWAQIHGRNSISWEERLSRDVDYVERLGQPGGLLLDLRILAATTAQVLLQAFTSRGVSASGHATMPEFLGNAGEGVPPRASQPSVEPPGFGGVRCPPEPHAPQRVRAAWGLRSIMPRTSSVVSGSCS